MPPVARQLQVTLGLNLTFRLFQQVLPFIDRPLQGSQRDDKGMTLGRAFGEVCPPFVVAAGITSLGLTFIHELIAVQSSTENQILNGVIQAVLDSIHFLLGDRYVEDGFSTILMEESHTVRCGYDAVTLRGKSLWGSKLITGLETFA